MKGRNNRTPLHDACWGGHLQLVEKLIDDYHCDPTARDGRGLTPLHLATLAGKEQVVRQLVTKYNCPVDCESNEGDFPLHYAAKEGHTNVIQVLLSELGADIKVCNKQNNSALNVAALNGHDNVVTLFVDQLGCSPLTKGFNNRTLLHQACGGGHLELVEKLIDDYHCDPMAKDDEGLTPLHVAAFEGKEHVVRRLLFQYRWKPDTIDDAGNTLVHTATFRGHLNLLKLLIDVIGCFPSVKNNQGKRSMDCKRSNLQFRPDIQLCASIISNHAVRKYRQAPHKVLVFDKSIALVIRNYSLYSLISVDHAQSIGLCYVNSALSDIFLCHVESERGFNSLLQRLMSGPLTAICTVNLDIPTDQAMSRVSSQISLVHELAYQKDCNKVPSRVLLLGTSSSDKENHFNNICANIVGRFKKSVVMFSKCFLTCDIKAGKAFLEKVFSVIVEFLIKAVSTVPKPDVPKITHGSIHLLKLLFREYGQRHYVKFSQLAKLLENRRIMTEGHPEEILACLRQLDLQGYLLATGTSDEQKMYIVLNPHYMLAELNKIFHKISDPLAVKGIFPQHMLSSVFPDCEFSHILNKLDFSLELPNSVVNIFLKGDPSPQIAEMLFFIPHLASCTQKEKCWISQPENIFSCGLCLEATGRSNYFPSQFTNSLLLQVMKLFVFLLNEPHGSVDCILWKGGIHWIVHGVEVVVEVLDDGRCVAVLGRSDVFCHLMCEDMMVKVVDIVLGVKDVCCRGIVHKVYVLDPDALKLETIPLATDVPCCDATRVARALRTGRKVAKSNCMKKTFSMKKLDWLYRFSLQDKLLPLDYKVESAFLDMVSEKWQEIARNMGLSEQTCHSISLANAANPEWCCSQMIVECLTGSEVKFSWSSLTAALRRMNVEHLADNILLDWVCAGHHARVQHVFLNDELAPQEVEERFLQHFAAVVEPYWKLLSPYINPTAVSGLGAKEESVIYQLQRWREQMHPTYGDLVEILSQLYIQPPLPDSVEYATTQDVPCDDMNVPEPCHHSCPESLSGLCSTPVHSGTVGILGGTIECKELGFSIVVPPGAVNYPVTVSVCCSFKKQLSPPSGYEFVSPIYVLHVTSDITFMEEVELSLNHWAKLSDDTRLVFLLSPVPVGDSSCVLEPQNGGEFFPHHGTIKTKHFSLGAISRMVSFVKSPIQYLFGFQSEKCSEGNNKGEPRENEEEKQLTGFTKPQLPTVTNEKDYCRLDSYQAFFVYPAKELHTNTTWVSSLSVCLNHSVFTTSSLRWMKKNYPSFLWNSRKRNIKPQGEECMVVLEPENSFAVIQGSEIPKETVDWPKNWQECADDPDVYPPRAIITLERSSENRKYTISIHRGITGECRFTLVSPKLVTARGQENAELLAGTSVRKLTVQLLHRELQTVQHRWYGMGLQLGLNPATLHTIRHDSGADCEMCMVATCEAWLNAKRDACWEDVVEALTVIRHQVLAEDIKAKYCTCK